MVTAALNPIYRCDAVSHAMNQGKESQILELLYAWRHVAVLHSREQWRLFFEKGKFDGRAMTRTGYEVVGTSVGILGSFISCRATEFRNAANSSSLDDATKHQLHFINRWKAWFSFSRPLVMRDGTVIPVEVRRLARAIMRGILRRHRLPRLHRVGMLIDQRMVTLAASQSSRRYDRKSGSAGMPRPISCPRWKRANQSGCRSCKPSAWKHGRANAP